MQQADPAPIRCVGNMMIVTRMRVVAPDPASALLMSALVNGRTEGLPLSFRFIVLPTR